MLVANLILRRKILQIATVEGEKFLDLGEKIPRKLAVYSVHKKVSVDAFQIGS
jgi:hypothetical protein